MLQMARKHMLVKFIALYSSVCKKGLKTYWNQDWFSSLLISLELQHSSKKKCASLIRTFLALAIGGCHKDHQLSPTSFFRLTWPFPSSKVEQQHFILLSDCGTQKTRGIWRQMLPKMCWKRFLLTAQVTAIWVLLWHLPGRASLCGQSPGLRVVLGGLLSPPPTVKPECAERGSAAQPQPWDGMETCWPSVLILIFRVGYRSCFWCIRRSSQGWYS